MLTLEQALAKALTLSGGGRVKPLDFAMNSTANDNFLRFLNHRSA